MLFLRQFVLCILLLFYVLYLFVFMQSRINQMNKHTFIPFLKQFILVLLLFFFVLYVLNNGST